eukprot:2593957-Rhodomonas_salina.4
MACADGSFQCFSFSLGVARSTCLIMIMLIPTLDLTSTVPNCHCSRTNQLGRSTQHCSAEPELLLILLLLLLLNYQGLGLLERRCSAQPFRCRRLVAACNISVPCIS